MADEKAFQIEVMKLDRDQSDPVTFNNVTFRIVGPGAAFRIVVGVANDVDDAEAVRVARSNLHQIMSQLAAETAAWRLPPPNRSGQ